MTKTFSTFFTTLVHPTWKSREAERSSFVEVLGFSWSFHLLYAIYSIGAIYLGLMSYEYLSNSENFAHMLFQSFNVKFQKFSLYTTLFQVIFYPFIYQFLHKFWTFLIKFYAGVFDFELDNEHSEDELIEDVVTTSFTANFFLIIPILGGLVSTLAQIFYLFTGLKAKLSFTNTQAFLVLLTPLFIMFLLMILIASYFIFLISLI
jgi:hypothetical protein